MAQIDPALRLTHPAGWRPRVDPLTRRTLQRRPHLAQLDHPAALGRSRLGLQCQHGGSIGAGHGGADLVGITAQRGPRTEIPYSSPLGHFVAVVWLFGPFVLPLIGFLQAPLAALTTLVKLGALLWLLNGALLWAGTTFLASRFAWGLPTPRVQRWVRTLTVAMWPISMVALAYLADQRPLFGNEVA